MEWIADALNSSVGAMNSPNSNGSYIKKEDNDYLNPPNFDHLLSRSQRRQQQKESFHRSQRRVHRSQRRRGSFHLDAESTLTNDKSRDRFSASFADDRVIGIGSKARIHPTEMQIYLRSLVQSSSSPDDMAMMKKTISKQVSNMTADGDKKGDLLSDSCDDPLRSAADSSPSPHAASASPQSAATVDPSSKKNNRQKNDKAVEVYKETTLIARFRTQTECARYLRATPEAVSYHCSKGGGVCNGLLVRPLASSFSAAAAGDDDHEDGNYFGLFEGSTTHRPSARPQLSPDVVALLKAWLLSPAHIDNPYPNGREYEMLMVTTKLEKMQLKHWFNNARKRILKPLLKNKDVMSSSRIGAAALDSFGDFDMAKKKRKSGNDDYSSDGSDALVSTKKVKAEGVEADLQRVTDSSPHSPSAASRGTQKMTSNLSGLSHNQIIAMQQQQQYDNSSTKDQGMGQMASFLFQQGNNGYDGIGGHNINSMINGRYDQLMGMGFNNGASNMLFNAMGNGSHNTMMGYGDIMGSGGFASMNNMRGFQGMDPMMMDSSAVNPLLRGYAEATSSASRQGMVEMYGRGGGLGGGQAPLLSGGTDVGNENPFGRAGLTLSEAVAEDSSKADCLAAVSSSNSDEAARSNAVFKQQVAAMAMNEASAAFKEMEDAVAGAKEIFAQGRNRRGRSDGDGTADDDEDQLLLEANAHAKKCQSVAMFKLKVSQRASEEAATAYNAYERLRGGDGGGGLPPFSLWM